MNSLNPYRSRPYGRGARYARAHPELEEKKQQDLAMRRFIAEVQRPVEEDKWLGTRSNSRRIRTPWRDRRRERLWKRPPPGLELNRKTRQAMLNMRR